uniref:Uncharacterized protein n=1 Tax=Arion vulgaris TaxID=1028688 RepID=A0A0B7BAF0_9EUPU
MHLHESSSQRLETNNRQKSSVSEIGYENCTCKCKLMSPSVMMVPVLPNLSKTL